MQLDWSSSVPTTALWGALAIARGRTLVEPAIDAALRPVVEQLMLDCQLFSWQAEPLLRQMVGQVTGTGFAADEVATALDLLRERFACDLAGALIAARPSLGDELPLRIDPLRSHWEARGPGLLGAVRRLTGIATVPTADLVLVHPMLGGGGLAHPRRGRVTFEGMLANPLPRLPEVVRLGWLLAQLSVDRPQSGEPIDSRPFDLVAQLALIPVVLAAAEQVELASADAPQLRLALEAWLDMPGLADTLGQWWERFRASPVDWPAGLAALQALLPQEFRP